MTTPAVPPPDDAMAEAVITAVTAAILAGATVAEVKAALLELAGMTSVILDKIFATRKLTTYVSSAVTVALGALPPIELASTVTTEGPAAVDDPADTPPPAPQPKPAGPAADKPGSKFVARDYVPQSIQDQIDAALAKKGKVRPRPKKPPAASTFVKLKHAVNEAAARAGYLTGAARRMQAAYDTDDQDVIAAAEAAEDRYVQLHEQAVRERARAMRAVAKATVGRVLDKAGKILLGWYAHISPATCRRCLDADGKNFDALEPPPIGFPGAVHLHDHCLPGAPHDTDELVDDIDPSARVSLAVAVRAVTDLRLRMTATQRGLAMDAETRTAVVTEVRGPTADKPDQKPGFTARAVQYGVADTYNTSWQRGVFKDSLERRMPSVVWCHDWSDPVGRVVAYRDSDEGLDIDVELDDFEAVPRARQAHAQLKSGSMSQFSFAFKRAEEQPDPKIRGCTRIVKADVDEFSIVLNGSVPGTHVTAVRTAGAPGTVDAKTAADIVTRFASGGLDLVDALVEMRSAASGVTQKREAPAQRFEFRATSPDDGTDPEKANEILAAVDAAMAEVAGQFDKGDVYEARRYYSQACTRLSELLYLLGMTPGVDASWDPWRGEKPGEVRTEVVEDDVSDAALLDSLSRIEERGWMRGRGGRR